VRLDDNAGMAQPGLYLYCGVWSQQGTNPRQRQTAVQSLINADGNTALVEGMLTPLMKELIWFTPAGVWSLQG